MMAKDAVMAAARNEARARVSVALTPELHSEISARAEQYEMSLNRTILQLLRVGLDAERQKKQRLEEMLREYRECADPKQAERLGDELGAMIFGR
jgi:hypothetical protein